MDLNNTLLSTLELEMRRATMAEQSFSKQLDSALALEIESRAEILQDSIFGKNPNPEEKEKLKKQLKEKTAINLIRGGLEKKYGLSVSELIDIYEKILKDNPEKLV